MEFLGQAKMCDVLSIVLKPAGRGQGSLDDNDDDRIRKLTAEILMVVGEQERPLHSGPVCRWCGETGMDIAIGRRLRKEK